MHFFNEKRYCFGQVIINFARMDDFSPNEEGIAYSKN